MASVMSPRERVLTALNRKRPDRVPKDMNLSAEQIEQFRQRTESDDPREFFRLELRSVGLASSKHPRDFSAYLGDAPNLHYHDEWGVGASSPYLYERMIHPLRRATSPRDLEEYPWPDVLADYRWENVAADVRAWQEKGYPVQGRPPGPCGGAVYENSWYLRGQAQLMLDFHDNPEFAAALLGRMTDLVIEGASRLAEAGVDILTLSDDVGSQRALLMSPDTWRKWLRPSLAAVIAAAKRVEPDILVFYHSDGYIEPIIPELIEAGVDILNPVQPECMDPADIKRRYGERLSFWGTVGTQTTFPHGTPDEVRRVVKERIETVGPEGLLLAPTHSVEADVPWENIVAFVEAVEEYGAVG